MRWFWGALGFVFLAIGIVFLLVPLAPTTPFLLLALACFVRASPRLEHWFLEHPWFGPHVRAWHEERRIPLAVKVFALFSIATGLTLTLILLGAGSPWLSALAVLFALGAGVFVFLLPHREELQELRRHRHHDDDPPTGEAPPPGTPPGSDAPSGSPRR